MRTLSLFSADMRLGHLCNFRNILFPRPEASTSGPGRGLQKLTPTSCWECSKACMSRHVKARAENPTKLITNATLGTPRTIRKSLRKSGALLGGLSGQTLQEGINGFAWTSIL